MLYFCPGIAAETAATPIAELALDKLPLSQQAIYILKQFESAKTQSDYMAASNRWSIVRPQLQKYEEKVACKDSGATSDKDIGMSVIEDLTKAPVELILSFTQLVFAFSGQEKDLFLEVLKRTYEEAVKLGAEKGSEKLAEPAKQAAKKALDEAFESLREALLQYLQSISKRSRKHSEKIIDSALGTLRGLGGAVATIAKLVAQPTKISPEWCSLLKQVDGAERDAFTRVFPPTLGRP